MSATKKGKVPSDSAPRKSLHLQVPAKEGLTTDRMLADLVADGEATNALTAVRFVASDYGELSLTDMVESLRALGDSVNRGDLQTAERMLSAQAVALNAIFAELARRASLNMGEYLPATDTYLRLAFKAQAQCRATVEALAEMKNPPAVFARQANINNGGQQQVNNGPARENSHHSAQAHASAHAGESSFPPNKLMEPRDVERLDAGAQKSAGGTHQDLATLGAFDRTEDRCGQGRDSSQCVARGD